MRRSGVATGGLLVVLTLVASAFAEPPAAKSGPSIQLIDHYDEGVIREIVTQMGHKVLKSANMNEERPFLVMETKDGQLIGALATACHGEGSARNCQGVQLIADMAPPKEADAEGLVEEFNQTYAAAKFFYVDGKVRVSRYVVLDDGVTRANFRANVDVLAEIAVHVRSALKGN